MTVERRTKSFELSGVYPPLEAKARNAHRLHHRQRAAKSDRPAMPSSLLIYATFGFESLTTNALA